MNGDLKSILNTIKRSEHLSAKEKKALSISARNVSKELEIESSLERVRTVAMSMNKPDDMLHVCHTISDQLELLNVKEIRNVQTAIFYKEKGTYMNYEYYTKHDKTFITETTYTNNKIHQEFANKMLKGNGEFMIAHIKGDEVKDWLAYQKTTNVFIDDYLNAASSLNYYWYSLGPVALGISTYSPLNEDETNLFKRFLKVFELSYRRYLDIEKAEAQAREAQIQLALERIRARTMAMQNSNELPEAANLLFQQIQALGMPAWSAGYCIWDENKQGITLWMSSEGVIQPSFHTPLTEDPSFIHFREAYERGESFHVEAVGGEELVSHYKYMRTLTGIGEVLDSIINAGHPLPTFQIFHCAYFSQGFLLFITYEPVLEAHDIFKRFAKVFEQTYTRFLDLQKAEAQTIEAQIETALEKVRSCSLAMHKTDELQEVVTVVFEKLKELGVGLNAAGAIIVTFTEGSKDVIHWLAAPDFSLSIRNEVPYFEHSINTDIWQSVENGEDFFTRNYQFAETYSFHKHLFEHTDYKLFPDEVKNWVLSSQSYTITGAIKKNSAIVLYSFNNIPPSEKEIETLKRFSKVFEQAYVRFLDLKKAEAQARESQIEAALERVRSRSMGMQKSDELKEVIKIVYDQFIYLNINIDHAGFVVDYKLKSDWHFWIADKNDIPSKITTPYFDSAWGNDFNNAKEKGLAFFATNLNFEEKNKFYNDLLSYVTGLPEESKKFYLSCPGLGASTVLLEDVSLYIENFSGISYSDEENKILLRFGKVFQQTYTRFLDLQKAEAQARESQIEAALERVRSKAMSMQKSEDLSNAVAIVFDELEKMDLGAIRCGISIINKEDHTTKIWSTTKTAEGTAVQVSGYESMDIHPLLKGAFNAWSQLKDFSYVLKDDDLINFYTALSNTNFKLPDDQVGLQNNEQHMYVAHFPVGGLYVFKGSNFSDDTKKVVKRFGEVFNLTYTRYNDLQIAETSAKEAIRQAALDRIRADIASMRTTKDLERITPLIWNELNILNVPFIRCGVFIMNDEQQLIHTFLSTPDGKAIAAFHIPYDTPGNIKQVISHWGKHKNYIDHWDEEAFTTFAVTLVKQGALTSPEQYLQTIPHGGFYLHFLPFLQGMLYVGNTNQLSAEEINLIQSIANAFSTAYARYEDFNKLETAKQQVDKTLIDLKQTQTQLIQSEKMASLGELTAGIAHEIQNPLNFVNNFSEVNAELIEELNAERLKPNAERNTELENEILNDIAENEKKINHHGKRADAIVKGMLQHSRSSTGEKEPTDINALADEYLRLSYQGLRAKDKSFNSAIKTDFDNSIGKINIIPQDIGRVLLNLYNNAFYAVKPLTPKGEHKSPQTKYEPTVTVTTRLIQPLSGGRVVEIKVIDNGGGISQKILDKIFQPFFTTKPTGQGTGLGLSLSYDIIKAHGGEIKVVTKEGEGSEFIIKLPVV